MSRREKLDLVNVVILVVGLLAKNTLVSIVGGVGLVLSVISLGKEISEGLKMKNAETNANAYAIKAEADRKTYALQQEAALLQQAYHDGKVSDEDISFLVRSLAAGTNNGVYIEDKPVRPMVKPIERPVVTTIEQPKPKEETVEVREVNIEETVSEPIVEATEAVEVIEETIVVEIEPEVQVDVKTRIDGRYDLDGMQGSTAVISVGGEEIAINIRDFNRDMSNVKHRDCESLTAWCNKTILDTNCILYLNIVDKCIELRAL